jgi:hypothetical protein
VDEEHLPDEEREAILGLAGQDVDQRRPSQQVQRPARGEHERPPPAGERPEHERRRGQRRDEEAEDVELPRSGLEGEHGEQRAQRIAERVEVRAGRARRDRQRLGRQPGDEGQQPDRPRPGPPTRGTGRTPGAAARGSSPGRRGPASGAEDHAGHDAGDDDERLGRGEERLGRPLEARVEVDVVDHEDHERQAADEVERDVAAGRRRRLGTRGVGGGAGARARAGARRARVGA